MIFCYIISSLALLAAVANIILFCVEKKRSAERRKAMLEYIDNMCEGTLDEAMCLNKEHNEHMSERFEIQEKEIALFKNSVNAELGLMKTTCGGIENEVEKLKAGVVPDYEAAREAANAVNDFNTGLSSILNFDPIAVAKSRRQGESKEAI